MRDFNLRWTRLSLLGFQLGQFYLTPTTSSLNFIFSFFFPFAVSYHIQHSYIVIFPPHVLLVVPFSALLFISLPPFSSHLHAACAAPQPPLFCAVKGQIYWDEPSLYLPSCLNCSSQSHREARWSRQGVERERRERQCLHTDECSGQRACQHIERLSRSCKNIRMPLKKMTARWFKNLSLWINKKITVPALFLLIHVLQYGSTAL